MSGKGDAIAAEVAKQGEVIRDLKSKKADKVRFPYITSIIGQCQSKSVWNLDIIQT